MVLRPCGTRAIVLYFTNRKIETFTKRNRIIICDVPIKFVESVPSAGLRVSFFFIIILLYGSPLGVVGAKGNVLS